MHIKFTGNKTDAVKQLYANMLDVLTAVGIPLDGMSDRRKEKMAGACLAVGQITTSLKEAKSVMNGCFLKTRDIINYENTHYGENISSGSYDDIRRKDLRLLVEARLVINSSEIDLSATNNPNRGYALDAQFARLLQSYNTKDWSAKLSYFSESRNEFREKMERKRSLERLPVILPSGVLIELAAGEHNLLQKKIVEQFLPLYGMGAQVLYIGDAEDKFLFRNDDMLKSLHCFSLEHEELPDVVAYSKEKNLLFLIEAVHSSGPMDEVRVSRLKRLLNDCTADVVFFTAFLNRMAFKKYVGQIAWETEVWIAESPEHMVHFNGTKFLEVYH